MCFCMRKLEIAIKYQSISIKNSIWIILLLSVIIITI